MNTETQKKEIGTKRTRVRMEFYTRNPMLQKLIPHYIFASPVTERDFYEGCYRYNRGDSVVVFCQRCEAISKETRPDGSVVYDDFLRTCFIDENGFAWFSGVASDAITKLHPISLPYMPSGKHYEVHGYSFSHNPETCEVWLEKDYFTFTYLDYYVDLEGNKHTLDMLFEEDGGVAIEVTDEERKREILNNAKPVVEESIRLHREITE